MTEQSESSTTTATRYRNWKAVLDLQPIVQPKPLRVSGEYHLNQRCGGVRLQVREPQGFNPRILMLELVEGPGDGGDWVQVEAHFAAKEREYDSVEIHDMDGQSILIPVEEIH